MLVCGICNMKHFAIRIKGYDVSEIAAKNLLQSSENVGNDFKIELFDAVLPENAQDFLKKRNIKWNWPWEQVDIDIATGLKKTPYRTENKLARMACFCSHYALWERATKETVMIFEHDALFIRRIYPMSDVLQKAPYVIGINDPRGATRRSNEFYRILQLNESEIQKVPRIDTPDIPQGLAGNSAYIITPDAAKQVIEKVKILGAWPNDALLCYQNFSFMRVTKRHFTRVQKIRSTTTHAF